MGRSRPTQPDVAGAPGRWRGAAAGLVLAALAIAAPAWPVPAGAAEAARARRAALLLQAAALTDRLEQAEAGVVAAQLRRSGRAGELATARRRVRTRAVNAYMRGTGASVAALVAPAAYLDVVAAKEREVVARYRAAAAAAVSDQRRAEAARGEVRQARAELGRVQAALDATIAAADARRAEELRVADDARRLALARQAAAAARARSLPAPGPGAAAGSSSYAPSPLDPAALLPRHRAATEKQLALFRSIPFGPVSPTGPLPAGLAGTGQRVEGNASWYGPGFNGRPTASGAIYDQEAWTTASKELPLGTMVAVTSAGRRVLLLVNDRGPYVDGRVLDLSAAAARALGVGGVAPVSAEIVAPPNPR